MTIEQYWTILVKRWRLIIMCFLLVGAGASIGSKLTTPLYQSTVLVEVVVDSETNLANYTSLLASDQLVQTEAILATSDPVLREVASHYKGLTAEQIAREVTSTPKLNSQLFEIDVVDPSPKRAAELANDIAATLVKQQLQMTQQSYLLIAQPAQPRLRPVQPSTLTNTSTGLVIGLLLGILLAAMLELLDTRVRTSEVLTHLLDWPVLATIWQAASKEDIISPMGLNANAESYRILRTNIGFSAIDKPLHTLVVTSPLPGDGKSVVAANLAIFMAKAGKNTLLIDANLRRPMLHEVFGLPANRMGLSNAVLAFSALTTATASAEDKFLTPNTPAGSSNTSNVTKLSLDPFVYAVDIPNLLVMPSGPLPPNPPELLDSKAMQRLLTALGSYEAEVVIFDTPPLLGLSDASILASKVDGTLVVVDITRANKGNLRQLKAVLARTGARVLGCVVNKQPLKRNDTNYSYYYSTDEQDSRRNHSKKRVSFSAVVPVTPHISQRPETQSQIALDEQDHAQ